MRITSTRICHNTKRPKPIFSIDVSRTRIITASLDGEIRIWSKDGEPVRTVKKHNGAVLCVRFCGGGDMFASGGDDGAVFVYRANGDVVASALEHESDVSNVVWTDKFLVSVGYDGYLVLYDLESFRAVRKTKVHSGQIKGIAVDRTSRHMCTQGDDGIVLYEDFEAVKRVGASEGIILESFFSRMSWSPDGKYLVSGLSFNNKYNTAEVFNKDLESEYSFVGHVAPCESVAFNPRIYGRERRYYIVAVSSQDRSLSFWCSLSPRPFLLVKNLTELPVLDMCWDEDGGCLFVCSYSGEVKRIDAHGEFGEVFEEDISDTRDDIFFSIENMRISRDTGDRRMVPEDEGEGTVGKKAKKVIRPVLISSEDGTGDSIGIDTRHSYLAIFNYKRDELINRKGGTTLPRTFGDFRIEVCGDRVYVSVTRGGQEFYRVHGEIDMVCVCRRYLCVYTGRIQLYHLETGVLATPFICADNVVLMDMSEKNLLYLQSDGIFSVFSLRKLRMSIQGKLPRCGDLVSLRLSRRYFMVAMFPGEEYFFSRRSNVWLVKTPRYNCISAKDTDMSLEYDDTLDRLENEFLIMYTVRDRKGLLRVARRVSRAASRMRETADSIELKLRSMLDMLVDIGERARAIEMIAEMNTNHLFQPFVFSVLRRLGSK